MRVLLMEVIAVLTELGAFLALFPVDQLQLPFLILQGSKQFLVFSDQNFLALFDHLQLLLEGASQLLSPLDLLIPQPILQVSDLLLKDKLVVDEYIIQLFILHAEILNNQICTFLAISSPLFFSYRFLIFR